MISLFTQAVRSAARAVCTAAEGTKCEIEEFEGNEAIVRFVFDGRTCADVGLVERCFAREGLSAEVRVITGPAPRLEVTARSRSHSSLRIYRATQCERLVVGVLCAAVIAGLLVSLRLRTEWF